MSDEAAVWEQAEKIAGSQYTRSMLWLIKNGIPFDIAHSLDWSEIIGWSITLSELESGKKFNWTTKRFQDK
jgi:hypothetical protein